MAITRQVNPRTLLLAKQGYRDEVLALPTLRWTLNQVVTGDLTGGDVIIRPDFTQLFPKFALSLEEALISWDQNANNATCELFIGMGEDQSVLDSGFTITEEISVAAAGFFPNALFSAGPHQVNSQRLGIPRFIALGNRNVPISLRIGNLNLAVYTFILWGYLWDKALLKRGFMPVRP